MNTADTYLSLLRQAIGLSDGVQCIEYGVEEVKQIAELAMRQGTGPLIYDQLLKSNPFPSGQGAGDRLKAICMQNMMLQEQMKAVMDKTLVALSNRGINAVVFKGFSLAQYYPQPHLRQWGDIDIYVGDNGYHLTAEILRNTWPGQPCFETEEDYFKHWNIIANGISIEAHRVSIAMSHPCDKRIWQRLEHEGMAIGDRLQTMGPEEKFNTLLVFIHSWHHYTESRSASIKQLCDVAMCLKAMMYGVQLERYLRRNLRRLRLTQVWQAYAWIMVEKLGLPQATCPLYTPSARKRGELLLERILHPKRQYTHPATRIRTNIVVRKLCTLRSKLHGSLSLWEISPIYALHDMAGKILDGLSRLLRGEWNRKWE